MVFSFYFTYKGGKFFGTFPSTYGEKFTVTLCPRDSGNRQNLALEWSEVSSKYITVISFYGSREPEVKIAFFMKRGQYIVIYDIYIMNYSTVLIAIDTAVTKSSSGILKSTIVENKFDQLSTDLGNLLETGNLSDVVLTDGSKDIRAHKLILSLRSSVFAEMFQHSMGEGQENLITIKDTSIEILYQLLRFMYTGTIQIKDSSMARELAVAAEKYNVKDLGSICSTMLKSVDLSNVLYRIDERI